MSLSPGDIPGGARITGGAAGGAVAGGAAAGDVDGAGGADSPPLVSHLLVVVPGKQLTASEFADRKRELALWKVGMVGDANCGYHGIGYHEGVTMQDTPHGKKAPKEEVTRLRNIAHVGMTQHPEWFPIDMIRPEFERKRLLEACISGCMHEYATAALGLYFVKNLAFLSRFDRVRVFRLGGEVTGEYMEYEDFKKVFLVRRDSWWCFEWNGKNDFSGHFDALRDWNRRYY